MDDACRSAELLIRRNLFMFFVLTACFLLAESGSAAAGFGGDSSPSVSSTHDGGGTWGAILRLSVQVNGSTARFTVSKKRGSFNTENDVAILAGSRNGTAVAVGKIHPGSSSVTLTANLEGISHLPQSFYARIANSFGYAWVGGVQISESGHNGSRSGCENNLADPPAPPAIAEQPDKTPVNALVNVSVTAGGTCRGFGEVKIQCTAEDSSISVSHPYRSEWIRSGETVGLSLTFYSVGRKIISCRSHDSYGAASVLVSREISVVPCNAAPHQPDITYVPDKAAVDAPVSISVRPGADPDGNPVRVWCMAEHSNRSRSNPYISDWTRSGLPVSATFAFDAEGSQEIACVTEDAKNAFSQQAKAAISIRYENSPPYQPTISPAPYHARANRRVAVSVLPGGDPDGDPVSVRCTAEDSSRDAANPYSSAFSHARLPADVVFTFYSPGVKTISCTSQDRKGAVSSSATRTITVGADDWDREERPHEGSRRETRINISVRSGPDLDDNQIKVDSASCTPFCPAAPVSFDQPYLPEYSRADAKREERPFAEPQAVVSGQVVYRSSGIPVAKARVYAWDVQSGRRHEAATDGDGRYVVEIDRHAVSRIQAEKDGFRSPVANVRTDGGSMILQIEAPSSAPEEFPQEESSPWPQNNSGFPPPPEP